MRDETTLELLRVVKSFGSNGCTYTEFAMKAYADSPEWKRRPKQRRVQPGGLVVRSAAGVLGRLRSRGLVEKSVDRHFRLTEQGRAFLAGRRASDSARATPAAVAPTAQAPLRYWVDARGVHWCSDGVRSWWWDMRAWVPTPFVPASCAAPSSANWPTRVR